MTLTLHPPSEALLPGFRAALAEYHAEGRHLELRPERLAGYPAQLLARETRPGPGRVPETVLWGVVDGMYVGRVSLRHALTRQLLAWDGHIGYEVRPGRRGEGHAHALLAGVLPRARRLGLTRVLLTCDETNPASARVIERAGGVLENAPVMQDGVRRRRYWIALQQAGPAPGPAFGSGSVRLP